MTAVAGRAPFSWIRGQAGVYPLFAVCAFGIGLVGYSCGRHLWTNPDLHVMKSLRVAGPVDDNGAVLARAKEYENCLFKSFGEGQKKTIF